MFVFDHRNFRNKLVDFRFDIEKIGELKVRFVSISVALLELCTDMSSCPAGCREESQRQGDGYTSPNWPKPFDYMDPACMLRQRVYDGLT